MAQDFKAELSEPSKTQSEHLKIQILQKDLPKPRLLLSNMLDRVSCI